MSSPMTDSGKWVLPFPKKSVYLQIQCFANYTHMNLVITLIALVAYGLPDSALAKRLHIVDCPNERNPHHRLVLLGAGVIFFFALHHYALFNSGGGPLPIWHSMPALVAVIVLAFYQRVNQRYASMPIEHRD
jgi:hypothetical protein